MGSIRIYKGMSPLTEEQPAKLVIGVLGGMGTYATINFFRQYAKVFPAEKEWERPRIIIDNNCTMPSRVRAILYDENVDVLVAQMTDSIKNLISAGANRIVLACNTSHYFLNQIYDRLPIAKNYVVNALENCAENLSHDKNKNFYLLATEGTIESGIYEKVFNAYGVKCSYPSREDFSTLRKFIEAVKQDNYTDEVENLFVEFVNSKRGGVDTSIILGCTELPILAERCQMRLNDTILYDPLFMVLEKLKEEFLIEK